MWVWFVDWGKFTFHSINPGFGAGGVISIVGIATPTFGAEVKDLA